MLNLQKFSFDRKQRMCLHCIPFIYEDLDAFAEVKFNVGMKEVDLLLQTSSIGVVSLGDQL